MKKWMILILASLMVSAVIGCGSGSEGNTDNNAAAGTTGSSTTGASTTGAAMTTGGTGASTTGTTGASTTGMSTGGKMDKKGDKKTTG